MARSTVYTRQPLLLCSKENTPVVRASHKRTNISTIREQWEGKGEISLEHQSQTVKRANVSPTLIRRMTHLGESEGTVVSAVQRELAKKHHAAKSKVGGVGGLGGGVSLWPAMDDMRLSREDSKWLMGICTLLVAATVTVFLTCHGAHITLLNSYSSQLRTFHSSHSLSSVFDQETFDQQLLSWHTGFIELQNNIHRDFDMKWDKSSMFEVLFIFLYTVGIIALLYLLIRNIFSKQRLTPQVIKVWISLLCVVTVWTVLSLYLLACAQGVESATQSVVHQLNEEMATLIHSSLDLTKYQNILFYWRTKCLPPTSTGVLSILGLLAVQDVSYYLQYYSLPILTAICTPVVKVVVSLRRVYSYS